MFRLVVIVNKSSCIYQEKDISRCSEATDPLLTLGSRYVYQVDAKLYLFRLPDLTKN